LGEGFVPSYSVKVVFIACLAVGILLMIYSLLMNGINKLIYLNPIRSINKISKIVLSVFGELGYIKSDGLVPFVSRNGTAYEIELKNGTTYENNLFITAMKEIYERVDNPRYIVAYNKNNFAKATYFNVPSIFGNSKSSAEKYYEKWKKFMGKGELVYTRNERGRTILFEARKGSFDYRERFAETQHATSTSEKWGK
jgi:hypothetical protein